MSNKKNALRNVREIGGFRLTWEEACKKNNNTPWLVIKTMSGQWQTRLRGDMGVTLMWRYLLNEPKMEEYLHGQLRMMQSVNTTIMDSISELFIQLLAIGTANLIGKDEKTVSEFNDKRMQIANSLKELVETIIPKEAAEAPEVTDEERQILKEMRDERINKDLTEQAAKEAPADK